MKGKRLAAVCLMLLLCALAMTASAEVRLMVVSDLHYMAKALYADSELFLRALRAGDGKVSQYSDELLSALALEAERLQPDALLVTGDLSFNGERASHLALARRFAEIEASGTPVWVIPGNHDINSATARGFSGSTWYATEAVTTEEFAEIYADFMNVPAEADHLSYVAPVGDRLWTAMTDVSFYRERAQTFGVFTANHAEWLEGVMQQAQSAGVRLITATHHSLLQHTAFSRDSFLMLGSESMAALARKYGVRLNLSGHLHVQHIVEQAGLADCALGAFCVWPHRYALVTLADDGALTYEARALEDAVLPEGFSEESRAWFYAVADEKVRASLDGSGLPAEEIDAMADYATRFNLAYFSGTYRSDDPVWWEDPARALWQRNDENAFWTYMNLVMNESTGDSLHFELPGTP